MDGISLKKLYLLERKGVVKWLKPYNKDSPSYHTTFAAVNLESYGMESILNSGLKSLEVARKEIKEGDLA
jgi:hypothetical protein